MGKQNYYSQWANNISQAQEHRKELNMICVYDYQIKALIHYGNKIGIATMVLVLISKCQYTSLWLCPAYNNSCKHITMSITLLYKYIPFCAFFCVHLSIKVMEQ